MNNSADSRRSAVGLSLAGSLIVIAFFIFINYSTGSRFPWFIYPTFAVLWWPLGVIFAGRGARAFSLAGSLLIIALLFLTNYLTSWGHPWFLYPSFAVVWWPLGVFWGKDRGKAFSLIASTAIIAFCVLVNRITSPAFLWFIYPAVAVVWWPLSVFFANSRTIKGYCLAGALILLFFFAADNYLHAPDCPWALLTVYPLLLWPACVFLGKRALSLPVALSLAALGAACYGLLNYFVFPGFPWAFFPAYLLAWWPLAAAFARRGRPMAFALCGTALSAAFFIALNLLTSRSIWAVYPIFALAWWPLSVYYFVYKPRKMVKAVK